VSGLWSWHLGIDRKLFAFLLLSMILPAVLVIIAHAQPYYEFPKEIVIASLGAPPTDGELTPGSMVFVVNVSSPVRLHLIYGIFVGFISGITFAVSLLYLRRQDLIGA
jgi:hypothetical protein